MTERKGIVHGMPNYEYHSGNEVSCSSLKTAIRSLAHYKAYLENGSDISPKVALDGNLIHCAILEPMEFDNRYIVSPKFDMRTTVGKAGAAAFAEAANGREPITQEQYDMAKAIQDNVSKQFGLGGGEPEVSIFWNDSESGLDCRCRPDLLNTERKMVIDVKSTTDCRQFPKDVLKYGYHVQESFYRAGCREVGIEIDRFFFLCVEKTPPFDFQIFELDEELVEVGYKQWIEAINGIAFANFSGSWPGYDKEVQIVRKPIWA